MGHAAILRLGERDIPLRGPVLRAAELIIRANPLGKGGGIALGKPAREGARPPWRLFSMSSAPYGTYHFEPDGKTLASATEGGSKLVVEVLDSASAVASAAISGLGPGETVDVALGVEGGAPPRRRPSAPRDIATAVRSGSAWSS